MGNHQGIGENPPSVAQSSILLDRSHSARCGSRRRSVFLTDALTHTHVCDSLSANLKGEEAGKNGTGILREVQEQG
jgi:hypothetical protein